MRRKQLSIRKATSSLRVSEGGLGASETLSCKPPTAEGGILFVVPEINVDVHAVFGLSDAGT